MDFSLTSDYDDQFFYLQVANVRIVFFREDIDKVINHLESLKDEMAMIQVAS